MSDLTCKCVTCQPALGSPVHPSQGYSLAPTLGPNDTYECWHLPQEDVPGKEVHMQGLEGTYPFCKNAVSQGTLLGGFRVQSSGPVDSFLVGRTCYDGMLSCMGPKSIAFWQEPGLLGPQVSKPPAVTPPISQRAMLFAPVMMGFPIAPANIFLLLTVIPRCQHFHDTEQGKETFLQV